MKPFILTVLLLSTIQLNSAEITITTSFAPQPAQTITEDQAKAGEEAFTFTVTANPPSTCDFTYQISAGLTVEGSGGADGSAAQGTVKFDKEFDYEVNPSITATLTVSELCSPNEQKTAPYPIILIDVNDNTPYFESSAISIDKTENDPNLLVTTLRAKDTDGSEQYSTASLQFGIEDDYDGLFTIIDKGVVGDWYTIELRQTKPLDYEDVLLYRVTVTATDCKGGCTPVLSAESVVTISVNDAPDQKPIFIKHTPFVEIAENTVPGTLITSVAAVDGDAAINQQIKYSLEDPSGWYQIGEDSGEITVKTSPDREDPSYESWTMLTITASELDDPTSTASVETTVHLTDVNDNPPRFSSQTYTGSVIETASTGFPITIYCPQLQVSDLDEGENAFYTLSIFEDVPFKVSPTEGYGPTNFTILVNGDLDIEIQATYTLTVHAVDAQNPSAQAKVAIILISDTCS